MAMYRHIFKKPYAIALLPRDHHLGQIKIFPTPCRQWLMYLEHKEGFKIQHALNGGKFKTGPYFLDGCAVVGGQPTAFKFKGCFSTTALHASAQPKENPLRDDFLVT